MSAPVTSPPSGSSGKRAADGAAPAVSAPSRLLRRSGAPRAPLTRCRPPPLSARSPLPRVTSAPLLLGAIAASRASGTTLPTVAVTRPVGASATLVLSVPVAPADFAQAEDFAAVLNI